jgi:hypothetical protein
MKTCNDCKRTLSDDCFHKRTMRSGKIGLQPRCKECATKNRKQYYKPHEYMRRKFNLSEEQYENLMSNNNCQVCGVDISNSKKCIDHCHKTEKIRGVLCNNCNTALGLIKDDIQILSNLIRYLEQP